MTKMYQVTGTLGDTVYVSTWYARSSARGDEQLAKRRNPNLKTSVVRIYVPDNISGDMCRANGALCNQVPWPDAIEL